MCDSNNRICTITNKNYDSVNSAISGNSRPYNNNDSNPNARGPVFKPNPIKHWRKQLIPRENSGTEKARVSQIMDRPGGGNYISNNSNNSNNYICGEKSINCIKTYIARENQNKLCKTQCINKPKRNSISVSDNYHTSSSSYLQSRVKLYDQRMAIQNIPGNEYKNPPTNSSTGSQEYHSQYTTDQSGCFVDCSCVVSVIYKPSNIQFFKQGAISSNVYTLNLKQKTDNLCVLRNTWGLDNVCSAKYDNINNTIDNNINNTALCKSKTNNISKRYQSGGAGHHTVCFYTPSSDLQPNFGSKLHSIRGTGTGSLVCVEKNICNICDQPTCKSVITRGKLRCKCIELTREQYISCGYTVFLGSEYIVNIIGELTSSDYVTHIPKAELKQVIIGYNVTKIDYRAFSGSALTSVTFAPNSLLETIGFEAFTGSALTSITIPASVTTIEHDAFRSCLHLLSVTFAPNSQLETIGNEAFRETGLTSIIIPSLVTTLEYATFLDCEELVSITIPISVNTIKTNVFTGCINLLNIIYNNISYDNFTNFVSSFINNGGIIEGDIF